MFRNRGLEPVQDPEAVFGFGKVLVLISIRFALFWFGFAVDLLWFWLGFGMFLQ